MILCNFVEKQFEASVWMSGGKNAGEKIGQSTLLKKTPEAWQSEK
jgi:hypothetical protein